MKKSQIFHKSTQKYLLSSFFIACTDYKSFEVNACEVIVI